MLRFSWATLFLVGCTASAPLSLPGGGEARSLILAFETDDGPKLYGVDLEAPAAAPITIGEDQPLFALTYRQTLEERALPSGEIEPVEGAGASRPIASDYEAFVADLSRPAWNAITSEELPDSIRGFRLPPLALGDCEARGGCFRYESGEEYCELPCVEPTDAEPMPPTPATEPESPTLTPCPDGWNLESPEAPGRVDLCKPVAVSCPTEDDVVYPGQASCEPAAGVCPFGDFPEVLPTGPVLYVLAGANGGDGSEGAPFGSVGEAVAAASAGTVIAVGKGSYPSVSLTREVSLVGACAETILAGITVSANASVSRVKVASAGTAVRVDAGVTADLEQIFVSQATVGLHAVGTVQGRRLRLVDSTATGILVEGDADLEQVVVRSAAGTGIDVNGGQGAFTDVRVSSMPLGARARSSGALVVERGWLTQNTDGLTATGADADLRYVRIDEARRYGLLVEQGASAVAARLMVLNGQRNVRIQTRGTAMMSDVYFAGAELEGNVTVLDGGTVEMSRGVAAKTSGRGFYVRDSRLVLADFRIRDNTADDQGRYGEGILMTGETTLEANRLLIERVVHVGIQITRAAGTTELTAQDVTIRNVDGPRGGGHGVQIGSYNGRRPESAVLAVDRVSLADLDGVGIEVVSDRRQEINDLTARRIGQQGIRTIGGLIEVDKADFEGVAGENLSVASGEMVVNDLRVHDTAVGVESFGWIPTDVSAVDSALFLDRFSVSGATEVGVLVRQFSRVTFGAGRIFGNEVGVEVRADGFDFSTLEGDVVYRDNREHNLLASGQ